MAEEGCGRNAAMLSVTPLRPGANIIGCRKVEVRLQGR